VNLNYLVPPGVGGWSGWVMVPWDVTVAVSFRLDSFEMPISRNYGVGRWVD